MSDAPVPAPTTSPADAVKSAKEAIESIRALFDTLVPPATISIVDVFGTTYDVPARLSARAQIRVLQKLESLASLQVADDVTSAVRSVRDGGYKGAALALVKAASDPAVLDALATAFESAFPEVVAQSRNRATGPVKDAADLFGVEEMASALVPFFFVLARRLLSMVGGMVAETPQQTAH